MFFKYGLQTKNKSLIFLIIQIHVLIFCLLAVLWGKGLFRKKSFTKQPQATDERKALFIVPAKTPQKPSKAPLKSD